MIKKLLLSALFFFGGRGIQAQGQADLVVFSYNRPLQLYAYLESLYKFTTGLGEVTIVYRADDDYVQGYEELVQAFPNARFWRQGPQPELDFKALTLAAAFGTPSDYVVFAVDDMIVTEKIDLTRCTALLRQQSAYGFYLRLGKNITYNYMQKKAAPLPAMHKVEKKVRSWLFSEAVSHWNYPHTVDMTIFAKADIKQILTDLPFTNPNILEASWAKLKPIKNKGLCFSYSKVVNIPLNLVQEEFLNNYQMDLYTAEELQVRFEAGLKIDIDLLAGINNSSPHIDYEPEFITRNTT